MVDTTHRSTPKTNHAALKWANRGGWLAGFPSLIPSHVRKAWTCPLNTKEVTRFSGLCRHYKTIHAAGRVLPR